MRSSYLNAASRAENGRRVSRRPGVVTELRGPYCTMSRMPHPISVEEAQHALLARTTPLAGESVELPLACGRVLAEAVTADRPYPPFEKSRVDGYALRAADGGGDGALLPVAFEVAAGRAPGDLLPAGHAARVFTGAPVPAGADTMVMQERCTVEGGAVRVPGGLRAGENLVPRGAECAAGSVIASPGELIGPARVGALASVGAHRVNVRRSPRVHVVATGSELVPIDAAPEAGQIRNSNAHALAAAARRLGGTVVALEHVADTEAGHAEVLGRALEADVVLISGGVSVGDYDLVPATLTRLGASCVFHGVRLQPGKPLWFGVRGTTLVFGLPGNPVSTLVNTELFVRPALRRALGVEPAVEPPELMRLATPLTKGAWRRRYVPVSITVESDGTRTASVVPFAGSGDVFGFGRADALAIVPENGVAREAGDDVHVVPLRTVGP